MRGNAMLWAGGFWALSFIGFLIGYFIVLGLMTRGEVDPVTACKQRTARQERRCLRWKGHPAWCQEYHRMYELCELQGARDKR